MNCREKCRWNICKRPERGLTCSVTFQIVFRIFFRVSNRFSCQVKHFSWAISFYKCRPNKYLDNFCDMAYFGPTSTHRNEHKHYLTTNFLNTPRISKEFGGTKTNGYQNVKFSKLKNLRHFDTLSVWYPHWFLLQKRHPNGYQNKRAPKCLVFRNSKF